jgi:release factor glutamine methyltransferase
MNKKSLKLSKEQQLILAHILKKSREFVIAHPELELTPRQHKLYEKMTRRLQNGTPLALILGHKAFFGLEYEIDRHTLIPRPETELLIEEMVSFLQTFKVCKTDLEGLLIDVGTGSGCIIISIVRNLMDSCFCGNDLENKLRKKIKFIATDLSPKALTIAKKNAKKHGVEKEIKFIQSDLLDFLLRKKGNSIIQQFSNITILANLPYLSQEIYDQAEKSVKNFEPKSALLSGKDGLDHYKKMFEQIKQIKQKNPSTKWTVIFEISPEQKKIIQKEFPKKFNLQKISFKKDLFGKWRMGIAKI